MSRFSIGLDYGTNSCRALVVNIDDGEEIGTSVYDYKRGSAGVIETDDPNLARQHPADYLDGAHEALTGALKDADRNHRFRRDRVVGIGVDTTASTPLPVDNMGVPLALRPQFDKEPAAMAWLWKDHTAADDAEEITALVAKEYPQVLAKVGGSYSSEWFWAKILRCARKSPEVFEAAHTWVELQDWIPASLTGTTHPRALKRGMCAAGHKGFFSAEWGGYPPSFLLAKLDDDLVRIRETLPDTVYSIAQPAGRLTKDWVVNMRLPEETVVAVGGIDAHMGAVGSGVSPGVLVKIMGTSTCDIAVWPLAEGLPDIPGISGVVPESVLPGMVGLEAGQAAVGDLFNWFVSFCGQSHEALTAEAVTLGPGESGLLALDWNNGNRSVLTDPRLTGLLVGQTLRTKPAEMYRALIEATAFGARVILERLQESGVRVDELIVCGGIAEKSPMTMQIYADVCNRPMKQSRSAQTCALGAAMAGAVASGALPSFEDAKARMTGVKEQVYKPHAEAVAVYDRLFGLYRQLHDSFGRGEMGSLMKELRSTAART